MGHPSVPNWKSIWAKRSQNPCGEIPLGRAVIPYAYFMNKMTEAEVQQFVLNEVRGNPEYVDQLAEALATFPQYKKYLKLLVMA